MLTASTGWASLQVGRRSPRLRLLVARTTDGGRRWTDVSPWGDGPPPAGSGVTTDFQSPRDAWVAAGTPTPAAGGQDLTVYHTTDGGRAWTAATVASALPGSPSDDPLLPGWFSFAGAAHGWLMVQPQHGMGSEPGELLATADGGRTWSRIAGTYGPGGRRGHLPFGGAIAFTSATTGWLAGGAVSTLEDLLYVTRDGGRTWQRVRLPLPPGHTQQQMVVAPPTLSGAQGVLPVWFQGRAATYLYVSADGGATWRYTRPVPSSMPQVLAIGDVVAVGGETVYHTADGGRTWAATRAGGALPVLLGRPGAGLSGADFADAGDGWLWGTEPARPITQKSQWATTPVRPFAVRTTDGGATWTRLDPTLLPGGPPRSR